MMMGGGMAAATKSASAVYRRKVRANQRRLTRRWFRPYPTSRMRIACMRPRPGRAANEKRIRASLEFDRHV